MKATYEAQSIKLVRVLNSVIYNTRLSDLPNLHNFSWLLRVTEMLVYYILHSASVLYSIHAFAL